MHGVVANLLPTRTTRVLLVTPPQRRSGCAAAQPPAAEAAAGGGGGSDGGSRKSRAPPSAEQGTQPLQSAPDERQSALQDWPRDPQDRDSRGRDSKDRPAAAWRERLSASGVPRVGSVGSLRDLGSGAAAKLGRFAQDVTTTSRSMLRTGTGSGGLRGRSTSATAGSTNLVTGSSLTWSLVGRSSITWAVDAVANVLQVTMHRVNTCASLNARQRRAGHNIRIADCVIEFNLCNEVQQLSWLPQAAGAARGVTAWKGRLVAHAKATDASNSASFPAPFQAPPFNMGKEWCSIAPAAMLAELCRHVLQSRQLACSGACRLPPASQPAANWFAHQRRAAAWVPVTAVHLLNILAACARLMTKGTAAIPATQMHLGHEVGRFLAATAAAAPHISCHAAAPLPPPRRLDHLPQGMIRQQVRSRQCLLRDRRGAVRLQSVRNCCLLVAVAVANTQHRLHHHLRQ